MCTHARPPAHPPACLYCSLFLDIVFSDDRRCSVGRCVLVVLRRSEPSAGTPTVLSVAFVVQGFRISGCLQVRAERAYSKCDFFSASTADRIKGVYDVVRPGVYPLAGNHQ